MAAPQPEVSVPGAARRPLTESRRLGSVLLFALLVRLAYVVWCPQLPLESEPYGYHLLASRWAAGEGLPRWEETGYEIAKPPLYIMFLGVIYRAVGAHPEAARVAQAFVWVAIIGLTYGLGVRVTQRPQIAWAGAALLACLPVGIAYTGLLFTETLFTLGCVFGAWGLVRAVQTGTWAAFAGAGALWGASALVSARTQYVPLIIAVALVAAAHDRRRALACAAALTAAFVLVILPWSVRTSRMTGQFVFLTTYQHNNSLWLAFNKDGSTELDYSREPLRSLAADRAPLERQRVLREEAWRQLRRYPFHYVRNSVWRFLRLWGASHSNVFAGLGAATVNSWARRDWPVLAVKVWLFAVHTSLAAIGLWGLWATRTWWPMWWVLAVPVLYLTALHSLLATSPRFQVAMWPFVSLFAAAVVERRQGSRA